MTNRTYKHGTRDGIRWAIQWLHERANEMNDPSAKAILNSAAFNLGNAAKRYEVTGSAQEAPKPSEGDIVAPE
jgi:hypothetical protein